MTPAALARPKSAEAPQTITRRAVMIPSISSDSKMLRFYMRLRRASSNASGPRRPASRADLRRTPSVTGPGDVCHWGGRTPAVIVQGGRSEGEFRVLMESNVIQHDILVVGAGLAGTWGGVEIGRAAGGER